MPKSMRVSTLPEPRSTTRNSPASDSSATSSTAIGTTKSIPTRHHLDSLFSNNPLGGSFPRRTSLRLVNWASRRLTLLAVFPEHRAQPVRNFTDRRMGFRTGQDVRHQIIVRPGSLLERPQPFFEHHAIARCPHFAHARDLLSLQLGIQPERRQCFAFGLLKTVHANHHRVAGFHRLLEF